MKIDITLVANAGLLIGCSGQKLLLDGLHTSQDNMFSPVPPYIQKQIMSGIPPFDQIKWMAFTHFHEDHFSSELVNRYLAAAKLEMLFIPKDVEEKLTVDRKINTCTIEEIDIPIGQCREIPLGQYASIIAFPVKHAGKEYAHVRHLCYVLFLGTKKILILGDADYDARFFGCMAGEEIFDAVIANPLFLHLPKGREVLTQALRTKELIFYHLPFVKDDQIQLHHSMMQDMKKYKEILPPMRALTDPLQKVSI